MSVQAAFIANFSIAYTVIFSIIVLAILLPRISLISRELHHRQSLLLLLPQELVFGVPNIRELVLEAVVEAESGEAGVIARRRAALATAGDVVGTPHAATPKNIANAAVSSKNRYRRASA